MEEVTLTARVPSALAKAAQSVARSRDETISQVIRRCLRKYVDAVPAQRDLMDAIGEATPASDARRRKPRKGRL